MFELHGEPTTHIVIEVEDATFVPIDPKLAKRFNITENIWAHQFATRNGIHIIFTKNRAAGLGYQTKPADDSADSSPNYHFNEHE